MAHPRPSNVPPRRSYRPVWIGLLVSALVHLLVLDLGDRLWTATQAPRVFRARLAQIPRFEPRRLSGVARPTAPPTRMVYVPADKKQSQVGELPLRRLQQPLARLKVPKQPLVLREFEVGRKETAPILEPLRMVRPSELGLADSMGIPSMDLLRIVDLARANREHAMIMPDLNSRRDLLGYVNLTRIEVYGAGNRGAGLDALARYARDNSHLLVRVNQQAEEYFISSELLKDPIIFLFQGAGLVPYRDDRVAYFNPREEARLGAYLRGGGFLYVEGDNRYLREMVGYLKAALGAEGEVFPVPADHPLYGAFFDFPDGFPGEEGKRAVSAPTTGWGWDYPAQAPDSGAANSPVDPRLVQADQEPVRPLGLWGVRWQGKTVALLSDIGLNTLWASSFNSREGAVSSTPALSAGLNVLVYALTRKGTLTPRVPRPVWMATRPQAPVSGVHAADSTVPAPDAQLLSTLDATLAVVRVPLGTPLRGKPLLLRINGTYTQRLPALTGNGVMLRNMPPGRHWLELNFAGITKQVEVQLAGGQVTTVTFGVNRFAFLRKLHVAVEKQHVSLRQWRKTFSDLTVDEVFLAGDRGQIERSAQELRR